MCRYAKAYRSVLLNESHIPPTCGIASSSASSARNSAISVACVDVTGMHACQSVLNTDKIQHNTGPNMPKNTYTRKPSIL